MDMQSVPRKGVFSKPGNHFPPPRVNRHDRKVYNRRDKIHS